MRTALEVFEHLNCNDFGIISPSSHSEIPPARFEYIAWLNKNMTSGQKYSGDEAICYYGLVKDTESRNIVGKFRRRDYKNNDRKIITLEQWLEIMNGTTNNHIYLTPEQAEAHAQGHEAENNLYLF